MRFLFTVFIALNFVASASDKLPPGWDTIEIKITDTTNRELDADTKQVFESREAYMESLSFIFGDHLDGRYERFTGSDGEYVRLSGEIDDIKKVRAELQKINTGKVWQKYGEWVEEAIFQIIPRSDFVKAIGNALKTTVTDASNSFKSKLDAKLAANNIKLHLSRKTSVGLFDASGARYIVYAKSEAAKSYIEVILLTLTDQHTYTFEGIPIEVVVIDQTDDKNDLAICDRILRN